jgi:hypothetical protein
MPLVRFDKQELTFSFDEANKLLAYMEKVGAYGGHKTGLTAFDVMQEFDVLELFTKIREIVRAEYDD